MPRHSQYGTEKRTQQTLDALRLCRDLESVLTWLEAQASNQNRRITKGDIAAVRLRCEELGVPLD